MSDRPIQVGDLARMSRNLFEEAAELELLALRMQRFADSLRQSESDRDAQSADARDKSAQSADPQEMK